MELLLPLGVTLLLLLIGGLAGTITEQRHLQDLAAREAALGHMSLTDLKSLPPGMTADAGVLVSGNVVIASDYLKQVRIGLRGIVGGEVRSYRTVMDRARREARLRMLAEAAAMGSSTVINIRLTTTDVGRGTTEVICYGTAVRTPSAARAVW